VIRNLLIISLIIPQIFIMRIIVPFRIICPVPMDKNVVQSTSLAARFIQEIHCCLEKINNEGLID
jgi:hypothetical protein